MARASKLATHPRALILRALRKSAHAMSAYELLEKMKPHGVRSAPIVYRALATLEEQGFIHKIHGMGAYIACSCRDTHRHALSVLTVCRNCKAVTERHDHAIIHHLQQLRGMDVNLQENAVIELPVICGHCA